MQKMGFVSQVLNFLSFFPLVATNIDKAVSLKVHKGLKGLKVLKVKKRGGDINDFHTEGRARLGVLLRHRP